MATSNATTTQQDPAQQILAGAAGLDDTARADAWEAFHSAKDQGELTTRLKGMNLPGTVAADLWEAKRGAGGSDTNGITPEAMQARSQQQAREAVQLPLTRAVQAREQAEQTLHAPMPGSFEGHPENIGAYIPSVATPAVSGAKDIAHGNISRGLHEGLSSVANASLPILPFVAAGAPLATVGTMATGAAGDIAGRKIAQVAGATPDQAELAGDIGGIAGGGFGGSKIPRIGERVGEFLDRPASLFPTVEKATNLLKRGVVPSGLKVEEEQPFDEMMGALRRHLPQYVNATPLEKGGARAAANMTRQAAQNIWSDVVEPVIDNYASVRMPLEDIGAAARQSATSANSDAQNAAIDKYADRFKGSWTVQQVADEIKELNGNKAITRFMDASPQDQAAMLGADPGLRGKVAALKALKSSLFDTVARNGGEDLGAQFERARRDYGLLNDAEGYINSAKVPNPTPMGQRVLNSVRGFISPRGADFYLHPNQTLLDLENPNRLIPKALNTLGKVGAERPEAVGRVSPVTLPSRMLPRAGESTLAESNPTLGTQAPGGPGTMPRVITLQGEQPSTALARIPGSTPTTHIPPSQFGQSLREFTMPRIEFEQSAQRALPPARTENIAPAKVAAPEPEAWSSKAAPGQIPRVSRSLGEAKAEHERSLQERLRRKR